MAKALTMKEVSKMIHVPLGTIKQWEKEFGDFLLIPRTKGGARLFSEKEMDILFKIKQYRQENKKIAEIKSNLQSQTNPPQTIVENSFTIIEKEISSPKLTEESSLNPEKVFLAMETYKQNVIEEVKEEIRKVVRKEIIEDVKKEISKGTYQTVKSLSNSIYKATEKTIDEIHELTKTTADAHENTINSIEKLSDQFLQVSNETSQDLTSISNQISLSTIETSKELSVISKDTSKELSSLSKNISKTSSEFAQYLNITNHNIYSLNKEITKERVKGMEEREQFRQEIIQRESAFQDMLISFREAAAEKEKKWWHFW